MKLKKCYVFSFGKLQDTTFNFEGGLNTIKQDNGWGKSTLASFIKCIFYGLNDSKKSVAENERLKYKTWNSTQKFGGFIEFEWGDREFKLERYFGNKQSEDTVSLVDLSTGKSFTNTDNLGARIFQIDEEGFLSTTYFSQKDFQVKSNTSITAKFNSICEMQDTEAFDKAFIKLEDKAKTYKKTGDKGLIADVKREIFAVGEQIQSANLASKTVESLKSGVSSLEKEVEQLKQKTTILTQKVTEAGKIEAEKVRKTQYDSYLAKRQEYLSQRAQLDKILNGQRPSEGELNTYIDCCNELNKVSEREKLLASDINQLSNKADNVNKNTAKNNGFLPFLLVSIVLACAGVAFVFTNYLWISIALFILSVFGIAGGIIVRSASGEKEKKSDDNNLYIEQKISDYNEYKSIREKYQQNISDYLSKFNVKSLDFYTSLSEISSAIKSVKIIDKEIDDLSAIILELEKDGANLDKANNLEDLVELKKQLGLIQDEYTKKANELARKKADLKYYLDEADRLSELEEKKEELLAKQAQYKEDYQILLKTLEFLNKADENLKVKYRAPLEASLNKYLSLISGNKRKALIDIDLNVTIEENGGAKQPEYYSKGEQNLFEICKRFALTDVLFTGEKSFIILDDPFYNLDDQKLKQALELIKKLSSEYQILYFVCHESRKA